ncbi:unnamed protein product [Owenia fusiformis]|uniref:Calcineurin-like phosphoesterase domain-containing protein n=1 Tax=Owenia fusiformis TaxID=6347 RepID=A0A8J1UPM0_OWEFU|nr:unnamed protein product [Owenia fusiformis]
MMITFALLSLVCVTFSQDIYPDVWHAVIDESTVGNKRVFVTGDVHGNLGPFMTLMREANLLSPDGSTIADDAIVIVCGDLVHRGPQSLEFVRLVKDTPNLYAVRGNNDDNQMEFPTDEWTDRATEEDWAFMKQLPYTIRVPTHNSIVVHAGLLPGKELQENTVFEMTRMRNILENVDGNWEAIEDTTIGYNWARRWDGNMHIFFGHVARRGVDSDGNPRVRFYENTTGLDTNCGRGVALSGVFMPATETPTVYSTPCEIPVL